MEEEGTVGCLTPPRLECRRAAGSPGPGVGGQRAAGRQLERVTVDKRPPLRGRKRTPAIPAPVRASAGLGDPGLEE